MAKDEQDQGSTQNTEQQTDQQVDKPDDENTTDTNAGEDAKMGTVADQPDDPEEAK